MINLINIIQSEKRHRDRFRLLLSLDKKIEKQIIYTQRYSSAVADLQHTVIKTPPKKYGSGIKFWIWALFDIAKLLKHSKKKWVVIEHATGFVLFFLKIFRFLLLCKPVLIIACYNEAVYYYEARVWRADNPELITPGQDKYYLKRWRQKVLKEKLYFWSADGVISNSPRIVEWASTRYKVPAFRVLNTINDHPVEKKGLNKNVDVLYVGSLTPAKGIISLLKALNATSEALKVVFVGKVEDQDVLWWKKVQNEYDFLNIEVHSFMPRKQLNSFYLNSNIFVLPTYSEGSPRVIIEALCYGCKVVASDIPGNIFPPKIKNNPIAYYPVGDHIKLKETILMSLKNPNSKIEKNTLFVEQFSEDAISEDLLDFYNRF